MTACSKDMSPLMTEQPQPIRSLTTEEQYLANVSGDFGIELFKAISEVEEEKNFFISPLSVSMALGMTMNGADSSTYTVMQQTLGFNGLNEDQINKAYKSLILLLTQADPKVLFEIANSIWYRKQFSFNPIFLEKNRTYFDATVLAKDFNDPKTVIEINDWVKNKTHGKITEVIDEIDPMTLMFLINAIYFKGTWQYEFDKEKTSEELFYMPMNQTSKCQLMHIEGDLNYYADEVVQMVDLPYGAGNFSMTVILPRKNVDIDDYVANLNITKWQGYIDQLDTTGVSLDLPKFKLEYKKTLNAVLKKLGMDEAFDAEKADFSRIIENRELYISRVLHKTFVQVDEEGTEAAAVTVVEMRTTSIDPPAGLSMRVDRPFVFVIRERQSGSVLFMGKIINPEWTE